MSYIMFDIHGKKIGFNFIIQQLQLTILFFTIAPVYAFLYFQSILQFLFSSSDIELVFLLYVSF